MDLDELLRTISSGYFVAQILTIVFLSIVGYVFIWATAFRTSRTKRLLLAFPAGLAYYCAAVYSMLVVKIRISVPRLVFVAVFAFAVVFFAAAFYRKKKTGSFLPDIRHFQPLDLLVLVVITAVAACICCAGVFSVSLDNDSYYYYSTYPQILIREGDLKYEFDVLLTDVGPVAAVVNTLPYIFGFVNTFGIQHFLNINFIGVFTFALYEELYERMGSEKKKTVLIPALLSAVFLATCPAYLTTAKWIMAGDYFMVYYFLLAYLGYRHIKDGKEDMSALLMLFTLMTTMLRQEGPVMTAFLVFCFCMLGYTGIQLSLLYIIPSIIAAGFYYLRIFVFLGVDPLYCFLTRQKALLIILMLLALLAVVLLLDMKAFGSLKKHLDYLIPLAAIAVNLAAFIINHKRYLTNLYMFFMNIRLRNGWGYFGYVFFVFILLAVWFAIRYRQYELSFFDVLMIGYLLIAVCAAWGRGDSLRLGTGDSGNRVMLTAVPLIVFSMTLRLSRAIDEGK